MMTTPSSAIMLSNGNTNNMNRAATGEDGCEGLIVIKQEPNSLQDYRSATTNFSNTTDGCNMLQKVPSLSDISDPENSLGKS